jgi:hypothetical protein
MKAQQEETSDRRVRPEIILAHAATTPAALLPERLLLPGCGHLLR